MRRVPLLIGMLSGLLAGSVQAQQGEDSFPLPPKDWPSPVMDRQANTFLLLDRLEYRWQNGDDAVVWDAQAWYGGDYNKLWLKSEGEDVIGGQTKEADVQALYARRIAPFWHIQAGIRTESQPDPSRNYAVLAIEGLAPYWFDVEASAFLRGGEASGRLEAEYDQLLTQRFILQPRVETNFSTAADPLRGTGSGFTDVELGVRLRYEIKREFAPYIGVTWTRRVGNTADIARSNGEDVSETALVAGVRMWF